MLRANTWAVLVLALGSAASAQIQGSRHSIKDVAISLSRATNTVGAIMSLRDFVEAEKQSAGRSPARIGDTQTAEAALTLFSRAHPEFAVQREGARIRFVRKDTPTALLHRLAYSSVAEARTSISASAAIVYVVGTPIRQQPTQGVLGSGLMPADGCPLNAPVKVAGGVTTPLDALDAIVAQVPGLAWFVLYEPSRVNEKVDVGLWCPDGMYFRVEFML